MVDITLGGSRALESPGTGERLRTRLRLWRRRARERAELARLGRRELQDIGMSPAQAAYEVGKPFWRA